MRGKRWGPEGPPVDAYSRVTEPERFAPLHGFALELLDRLQVEYEVERAEAFGIDPEVEQQAELARPTVKLKPPDGSAPIVVAFTVFPGLIVRFGAWHIEPFPICGCDACDETADAESMRLSWLVEQLVGGRFYEEIHVPVLGDAWRAKEFWSTDGGKRSGRSSLSRFDAVEKLRNSKASEFQWQAWLKK